MERLPRFLMIALIVGAVVLFLFGFSVDEDDPATFAGADVILIGSYAYFILAGATALIGAVANLITKPKGAKNLLIGVGGILVVYIIAYLMSTGSDYEMYKETSETASHWSGSLLYTFYILAVLAIGSIVFSGIYRMVR